MAPRTPKQNDADANSRPNLKQQLSFFDQAMARMTQFFGTAGFFVFNALFFLVWLLWNYDYIPRLSPFDPYPFGLLTMIVSLEAIFLSIIVLITQNRESKIADLREQIDFEINVQAENEITKVLNMLDDIHRHLGLRTTDDAELQHMKEKTNVEKIKDDILRKQLGE